MNYILIYNVAMVSPMLLILLIYLNAKRGTDDLHDALHEKARSLNLQLTIMTFAGVGIFLMADAGWYFALGHALIKGRYF